ncbi:MAG: hypothetical protein U5N86_00375 [Planctomycetota bacterium]|nr:hypothetical protein [Planctomycetota bacterium]
MADRIMPCPHCGKQYNISTFKPGMKFRCTECNEVVTVPGADEQQASDSRSSRRGSRSSGGRRSRPGASAPRRSPRRRREFDEEDLDRDRGRYPKKKDNTTLYAILGAVGFLLIVGLILAFTSGEALRPTTAPPDATPSNFTGKYGTAKTPNWDATPSPGKTPAKTMNNGATAKTDSSGNNGGSTETSAEPGKTKKPAEVSEAYVELDETDQEIQDYVAKVIENYGGFEAMKFNNCRQYDAIVKSHLQRDDEVSDDDPMKPFAWTSETEYSATIGYKRSSNKDMLFFKWIQASLKISVLFDGETLRRFVDNNGSELDKEEAERYRHDAYDRDIMYKLAHGQFKFRKIFGEAKRIRFDRSKIRVNYFLVADRISGKQIQMCFYNDPRYEDWKDLPAMITYKDEMNNEKVNKYYWDYGEKNKLKFPHNIMSVRNQLEPDSNTIKGGTQPEMKWIHVNKENDDELGEIKFGNNTIDDSHFKKPR